MKHTESDHSQPEQRKKSLDLWPVMPLLVGGLSLFVGGLVLVGWAFDITLLTSILPIWVAMKANTALAFILAGVTLLASAPLFALYVRFQGDFVKIINNS